MNWESIARCIETILAFPAPDQSHIFDVPQVPDVPTEDDVRRATERLIELEGEASTIPQTLLDISGWKSLLSHQFVAAEATFEQQDAYFEAFTAADTLLAAWLEFQQLLAQQVGHWQAAVAVMEHDLEWQRYEAAGAVRSRRARPLPAAALAVAVESWTRCS